MKINEIKKDLYKNQDKKYQKFESSLIPNIDKNTIIGVRTPVLKNMAKKLIKENLSAEFIKTIPHKYFEENQIHSFILSESKDFDECIKNVNSFLKYVDNWATCDQLCPKVFKKYKKELLINVKKWINTKRTYYVRFGIKMLMSHFLDEDFDKKYLKIVSSINSNEYYINMMIAWYFATALAKQYDDAIIYIEKSKLSPWVHNQTIKKAMESYRVSDKNKKYLKSLKLVLRDSCNH